MLHHQSYELKHGKSYSLHDHQSAHSEFIEKSANDTIIDGDSEEDLPGLTSKASVAN